MLFAGYLLVQLNVPQGEVGWHGFMRQPHIGLIIPLRKSGSVRDEKEKVCFFWMFE